MASNCYLNTHPDWNGTSKSWLESEKGKAWTKKGISFLPRDKTLSGAVYNPPQKSGRQGESLMTLSSSISNDFTHEGTIKCNNQTKTVFFLLDTGALQGNYVSTQLATWLRIQGARRCACDGVVCSGLGNTCSSLIDKYEFCLTFVDETNRTQNLVLQACTIDTCYDLIIGLPSIRKHSLLHLFSTRYSLLHSTRATVDMATSAFNCLPATLALLREANRKPKAELLSVESDDDEVARHDNEPSWDDLTSEHSLAPLPTVYGSDELRRKLTDLCHEYFDIFSTELRPEPANIPPMEITVDLISWRTSKNRGPPRIQTASKQFETSRQVENMLTNKVIRKSQATEYSQVLLTPKPNNKWRFCVDFRNLNNCSNSMGWPIPNIEKMLQRIGRSKPKFFALMDLTSGYHQAPISLDSACYTAFITFMGVYEWLRVPMGLKGAPSYFQQMMASVVLVGLIYIHLEIYLDDILVYAQSENDLVDKLRAVFERFRSRKLTLNPSKCNFGQTEVEFVGHVVNEHGITFSREKLTQVISFRKPSTHKEMKSFLGLANYFRTHIRNHSVIVHPLHEMVRDYHPQRRLQWNSATDATFVAVQDAINACPTLYFIDEASPISLNTDASDYGIGGYLYQVRSGQEFPIAFLSKALSGSQLKWSTIEKECYAIFYALKKLEYLIRDIHFTLRTDHKNLMHLNDTGSSKVKRWKSAIQEYDFDIEHIPGVDNIAADAFSRLLTVDVNNAEVLSLLDEFSIPPERYKLIAKVHNSLVGHHGVDRTMAYLHASNEPWPYMREHVKRFIKKCPCCQKMSYLKIPIHTHAFTTASYEIMERININTIGPLPADEWGNAYILVMIDCFSRFVELYATCDVTALSAAKALLQFVGRYGCPSQILSDNGPQFVNGVIAELTSLLGSEHVLTMAYSHEENSIVERANKEVMRHLRGIVFDNTLIAKWSSILPMVQRIINAQVHDRLGVSPAQILFGNTITLDRGFVFPHPVAVTTSTSSLSDWTATMLQAQADIIRVAHANQTRTDATHRVEPGTMLTVFPVGSYVLVQYENRPPSKLHPQLKGPMRVVNNIGSRYTVQNLVTMKLEDFHVTRLKPFLYDDSVTIPRLVANRDQQVFDVDHILAHRGDPKRKSSLEFLVRWTGYTDAHDTWEPWNSLRDTHALHRYLSAHRLKALIPKKYVQSAALAGVLVGANPT